MAKRIINWTHPEVVPLIDGYLQHPKHKSLQILAVEVTDILGYTVTKRNIQSRIESLRKSKNFFQPASSAITEELGCQPLPPNLPANYENLKLEIDVALTKFKDRTGIACDYPNLSD